MRIHELIVRNFRGFAHREFKFRERLTLIVGENGTGKTSILEGMCVALGGWLCGFDGLESQDKRNIIKADRRMITSKVNSAMLEQIPVVVSCIATLPTGIKTDWTRSLTKAKGRTTTGGLSKLRKTTEAYNDKIYTGTDEGIVLPVVAYYSAARLWNEPIHRERSVRRDNIRLDGYKRAIAFSNSIKDTMHYIDRLAYLAYRDNDQRALAMMNAIIHAIYISLENILPGDLVFYDMKQAEFCVKSSDGTIKPYSLFSDGYRGVISLIIDICRRIMMLNPQLGAAAIQETPGVILIDEIDLHLHPRWQQKVLDDLLRIFPQVQFIVTTHAPSVIQSVRKESLMILDSDNTYYPSQNVYGRDVNSILLDIMGAKARPEEVEGRLAEIYKHIDAGELGIATEKVEALEQIVGSNDPELTGIKVTIDLESMED